jgi:hypothetical protein
MISIFDMILGRASRSNNDQVSRNAIMMVLLLGSEDIRACLLCVCVCVCLIVVRSMGMVYL